VKAKRKGYKDLLMGKVDIPIDFGSSKRCQQGQDQNMRDE
jgi:hypothetical protein